MFKNWNSTMLERYGVNREDVMKEAEVKDVLTDQWVNIESRQIQDQALMTVLNSENNRIEWALDNYEARKSSSDPKDDLEIKPNQSVFARRILGDPYEKSTMSRKSASFTFKLSDFNPLDKIIRRSKNNKTLEKSKEFWKERYEQEPKRYVDRYPAYAEQQFKKVMT